MSDCSHENINGITRTNNNPLPPLPSTSMPEYLYQQSFHQFIPQCTQFTSINTQNLSNPSNYQNFHQNLQEPQIGQNQQIHSNSGILPSFSQEIPNSSQLNINEVKNDVTNIIPTINNIQSQIPSKSSSQNLNPTNEGLNIQRLSPNNQQQQQQSSSQHLQIPQQQFKESTGNHQHLPLPSSNFSTSFPFWLDYQNNNQTLTENSISSEYYPPFTSMAAAFDYNNNGQIMMGMLPAMYPQNFQIQDEQPSSQYFSVGGLYDSLAAAAAIAAGQMIDPSQIIGNGNFCWPSFDYYGGGGQNSSINWTHWGYPTPLIDNNVGDLINQQNHSAIESGSSLNVFDSICPIIEGNTEIKNHQQINSNNSRNWQKTAALLAAASSSNNFNSNRQITSKFLSKRSRVKGHTSSLTATNGNGSQQHRMEGSQSGHSNTNSSTLNANEFGGILENENEQMKLQTISPLLLNFPPIQQLTSSAMREYLANPGRYECAMWIFHAKVAQKSYGNEKSSDFLSIGDTCHEILSELSATIGINQPQNIAERLSYHISHPLDFSNGKTNFSYACGGIDLGTFSSQRIKVISKPSKKKQSMKSSDCKYLCVSNGSKIALFNRLRSQTVSTRYLHVENGCFHASSTKWGAFHINSDNPQPFTTNNSNNQTSAIITYGSIVQLVDAQNIALPRLRIRKVDKQMVLLDPSSQGEPVSQLHKCAFQMVDTSGAVIAGQESLYLCLSHDKIIQHQAVRIDPNRHQISDGAAWTIISTDKSEYRWAEPLTGIGSFARLPITPMPQLHNLNISNTETEIKSEIPTNIELNGSNFSPSIRVWLGATPTETIFCSSERLNCLIPSLNSICSDLGFTTETAILANSNNGNEKLDVPILLIREEDSVVFPTSLSFTYSLAG
uniref:Uncharacterized protein n=1 Tax=Meloidogyne hapla TaxID=6305 RepID=A0A1I8BQW0_MELHA